MKIFDFVIIGAGVVGLTVARSLALKKAGRIAVLEKESELGKHSSGRNSGVVHAGIYYAPGSLKARLCVEGARELLQYAKEQGIGHKQNGKVIVATTPAETAEVERLYVQATANGVRVEIVDEKTLREIEPEARTVSKALYSPDTAVIDSKAVLKSLENEITSLGVSLFKNAAVKNISVDSKTLSSSSGDFAYGYLINAAGLHADKIAKQMGVGEQYRILPFKGLYKKLSSAAAARLRGSIYPVPDRKIPFLGVHLTPNVDGDVMVGPTAIPALGREQYGVLKGFSLQDSAAMGRQLLPMMAKNTDGLRQYVSEEFSKYAGDGFYRRVQALAPFVRKEDILASDKVGIRAQLVDVRKNRMVMDFVVEQGPSSTHVLNAVSPAFTSSLAFADWVTEGLLEKVA